MQYLGVKPRNLVLNDIDKGICQQLDEQLRDDCIKNGINLSIICDSALKVNIPEKIDLLTMSTNKDILLSFLHMKSEEIKKSLGKDGIITLQMGIVSTIFWTLLLDNTMNELSYWPWSENITPLKDLVANYRIVKVGAEVIFVGSNNENNMTRTIENMMESGATLFKPFMYFQEKELN